MTGTQVVLEEIVKTGAPIELQAGMAAIFEGEGGKRFNILFSYWVLAHPGEPNVDDTYGNRSWLGPLGQFPPWGGAVDPRNPDSITHAAGVGQAEPATYRSVIAHTNRPSFEPQDQIYNMTYLAMHDFAARSGGRDFLSTLQASASNPNILGDVHTYLVKTWPGGADTGFPKRYASNLLALKSMQPSAPPAPPPPVPGVQTTQLLLTVNLISSPNGTPVVSVVQASAKALM